MSRLKKYWVTACNEDGNESDLGAILAIGEIEALKGVLGDIEPVVGHAIEGRVLEERGGG